MNRIMAILIITYLALFFTGCANTNAMYGIKKECYSKEQFMAKKIFIAPFNAKAFSFNLPEGIASQNKSRQDDFELFNDNVYPIIIEYTPINRP